MPVIGFEWNQQDDIVNHLNMIQNKTLILSNDNYKKYDTTLGWQTVSATTPTTEGFLEHGIDDISTLSRKVQNLPPQAMIDKTSILFTNGEVGKVFSKTLDLGKYMDIRSIKAVKK